MSVEQLIQENPQFSNYAARAAGVKNLAEYFTNAHAAAGGQFSKEWFGILNRKSKTVT